MRRMRRLRKPGVRELVAETRLSLKDMIQPIFVDERTSEPKSHRGHARAVSAEPGEPARRGWSP